MVTFRSLSNRLQNVSLQALVATLYQLKAKLYQQTSRSRVRDGMTIVDNLLIACFFMLFYRKIHYLTREFRVKLHAKTDIARIAKR